MAEETPLNAVGPGAGPNRTQNRNPFEVGGNAGQEPNANRLQEPPPLFCLSKIREGAPTPNCSGY